MIKNTICNASSEYAEEGVKYKLIISHVPFPFHFQEPFNIERELFSRWSSLTKENIHPDIMLCGHVHKACISEVGSELDELGQPCTIVVGTHVVQDENKEPIFAGTLVTLCEETATVTIRTEHEILTKAEI